MDRQPLLSALRTRSRVVAAVIAAVIAITVGTVTFQLVNHSEHAPTESASEAGASSPLAVPVETIGQGSVDGEQPGTSWPGEVTSAGDAQVQPPREGTVVEWKVGIGQSVQRGQVLGRLLAPASPEFASTLAEAGQALAGARADLDAQVTFSGARKKQLAALRTTLEQGLGNRSGAPRAASSDVAFRVEVVRDFSAQAVRAIYLHATNKEGQDPIRVYRDNPGGFTVPYRMGAGKGSEAAKSEFSRDIVALMRGVVRNEDVAGPALQFLRSADALVASSSDLDGIEELPAGARDPMREFTVAVSGQRAGLFEKIAELNEARFESADVDSELPGKLIDFRERISEVNEQMLDVDKELGLARRGLQAAQAAYDAINDAVGSDVSIVAPQSGAVSALFKSPGEFVEPGSAVASVNAGSAKTIRFRIPGNVTAPKAGDTLTALRPGFAKDVKRITVTGVGEALDRDGSRLADASFTEPVDWPVHASARVTAGPGQAGAPPLVSLTAIWFDDQGRANVWLVDDDDRIKAKPVKTGRTLGDKVELLEGGKAGSRIVSVADPAFRSGLKLPKAAKAPKDTSEQPAGDGHDHEH